MAPLRRVFAGLDIPDLLSGIDAADDAAVYRLSSDRAVIFTTDFFTPVVDDAYAYGAIAAANAMSDVYAMGGEVVMGLNIAGFPENLPESIISEIFRGGAEKVRESGGVVAGGHTVDSKEPFFGMAVIGFAHPDRVMSKSGAKPGDCLILTKPLGSGIITTAFKGDMAKPGHVDAAITSMMALNRLAAREAVTCRCRTATDVTGFSLAGHALEIARNSHVNLTIRFDRLPFLDGAREYADQWLFPAGATRNQRAFQNEIDLDSSLPEESQMLLFTPETSGGLLLSIAPEKASDYVERCARASQKVWTIGTVSAGKGRLIIES